MIILDSDKAFVKTRIQELFDLMNSDNITISDHFALELLIASYASLLVDLGEIDRNLRVS